MFISLHCESPVPLLLHPLCPLLPGESLELAAGASTGDSVVDVGAGRKQGWLGNGRKETSFPTKPCVWEESAVL